MAQKPASLGFTEAQLDFLAEMIGRSLGATRKPLEERIALLEARLVRQEQLIKLYSAQNNRAVFNRGIDLVGFGEENGR